MTFEADVRAAAQLAEKAVQATIEKYRSGLVTDEPEITGVLVGRLDAVLEGCVGGLAWSSTIVRSASGKAAEEKKIGADLLINVRLDAYGRSYNKGVLIQAKRADTDELLSQREAQRLHEQSIRMTNNTYAAYVFVYARNGMRCGGAASFFDNPQRNIHANCPWTSYRFFLELFRCPIGDPLIRSPFIDDLPVRHILKLEAQEKDIPVEPLLKVD